MTSMGSHSISSGVAGARFGSITSFRAKSLWVPQGRTCNQQVAAAAARQGQQERLQADAGVHSGPSSSNDILSSSHTVLSSSSSSSTRSLLQPNLSATSLLERSAAAPRPAAPPPHMEASTSSTSSTSSSSSSNTTTSSNRRSHASHQAHSMQSSSSSSWAVHVPDIAAVADEAGAAHIAGLLAAGGAAAHVAAMDELAVSGNASSSSSSSSGSGSTNGTHSSSSSSSSSSSTSTGRRLSDAGWQLMQAIMNHTNSWEDLGQLITARSSECTAQHCAAALYRLAALWQQQQLLVEQQPQQRAELHLQQPSVMKLAGVLLNGLQQQMKDAEARDLADALYAVVNIGLVLAPTADEEQQQQQQQQQHRKDGRWESSRQCGPLVSAARQHQQQPGAGFLAALLQRSQALMKAGKIKPRQLTRVLWGFAHLGINPGQDWWAVALETAAGQLQQQQQQRRQCDEHCYSPVGISLLGWAVAKLQAPGTQAWWGCYIATAQQQLQFMGPQELTNCLWALASARQTPEDEWMASFYSASSRCLQNFSSQGLANVLWALAVLQQQPKQQWLQQFEAVSCSQLHAGSSQHLSMTFWALGSITKAGRPYQNGSSNALQHNKQAEGPAAAAVAAARPSQLSAAMGSQQQQQGLQFPSQAWMDQAWAQLSRVESDIGAQGLACVLWGLVQLGAPVPEQRLQQLERLAVEVLRDADPQGFAIIVWSLGTLRGPCTSRAVVQRLRHCCQQQPHLLRQLTPQGLLMLLRGLSSFRAWHPAPFKQQLLQAVQGKLQQQQQQQQQEGTGALPVAASTSSSRAVFSADELPVVLLSLSQLQIMLPTRLLQQCEAALLPQLPRLSAGHLSLCIFALGAARHNPSSEFLAAALARLGVCIELCHGRDVGHMLYGLAAMGGCQQQLREQQQQELLQRLLDRSQQVLPSMNHSSIAMLMWGLARLNLRPSEHLLHACLAATTAQLPAASLLSITSILAALQELEFLPPRAWMVETCNTARAKLNTDLSPKPWQRRTCMRRLEEAVVWFNAAVQQQGLGAAAAQGFEGGQSGEESDGEGQQQGLRVVRRAPGMLGSNTSSEAMIAAAVGVAAAVAQQWHP